MSAPELASDLRRGFLCLDLPCSNPRQKTDDGNQRSRHLNSHHKLPERCYITPGIEQWSPHGTDALKVDGRARWPRMPRSASSSKSISTHRSWEGSSTAFSMCLLISRRRSVVAPEQFGICSNPISLDSRRTQSYPGRFHSLGAGTGRRHLGIQPCGDQVHSLRTARTRPHRCAHGRTPGITQG